MATTKVNSRRWANFNAAMAQGFTHPAATDTYRPVQSSVEVEELFALAITMCEAAIPDPLALLLDGAGIPHGSFANLAKMLADALDLAERGESLDAPGADFGATMHAAALLLEPFVVKLLITIDVERVLKEPQRTKGFDKALYFLKDAGHVPHNHDIHDFDTSRMKDPAAWSNRGSMDNAVRMLMGRRIGAAHRADSGPMWQAFLTLHSSLAMVLGCTYANKTLLHQKLHEARKRLETKVVAWSARTTLQRLKPSPRKQLPGASIELANRGLLMQIRYADQARGWAGVDIRLQIVDEPRAAGIATSAKPRMLATPFERNFAAYCREMPIPLKAEEGSPWGIPGADLNVQSEQEFLDDALRVVPLWVHHLREPIEKAWTVLTPWEQAISTRPDDAPKPSELMNLATPTACEDAGFAFRIGCVRALAANDGLDTAMEWFRKVSLVAADLPHGPWGMSFVRLLQCYRNGDASAQCDQVLEAVTQATEAARRCPRSELLEWAALVATALGSFSTASEHWMRLAQRDARHGWDSRRLWTALKAAETHRQQIEVAESLDPASPWREDSCLLQLRAYALDVAGRSKEALAVLRHDLLKDGVTMTSKARNWSNAIERPRGAQRPDLDSLSPFTRPLEEAEQRGRTLSTLLLTW